jgi:hypothetical protein
MLTLLANKQQEISAAPRRYWQNDYTPLTISSSLAFILFQIMQWRSAPSTFLLSCGGVNASSDGGDEL